MLSNSEMFSGELLDELKKYRDSSPDNAVILPDYTEDSIFHYY